MSPDSPDEFAQGGIVTDDVVNLDDLAALADAMGVIPAGDVTELPDPLDEDGVEVTEIT